MSPAASDHEARSRQPTRCAIAAAVALLLGAVFHLYYLIADCPLDLSGDEAHYWEWSRRLDLSYYSKGPLVAYIIAAGRWLLADWSMRTVGTEVLAVRVPAIALSVATGLGIYRLAMKVTRQPRVALGALLITFAIPIFAAGAILMTIDAPLVCCWVWCLVALHGGLCERRWSRWIAAGGWIALGTLAKYNMLLLLPAVGVLMLVDAELRPWIRKPQPYVAAAIGLSGLLPIAWWNMQHDWVSFRHVAGQAGMGDSGGFQPAGVIEYVGGQAAVCGVVWFFIMLLAWRELWNRPVSDVELALQPVTTVQQTRAGVRLLIAASVAPYAVFLLFSPFTKIQPNWPVAGLAPAAILIAIWIRRRWLADTSATARRNTLLLTISAALIGSALVLVMHRTDLLYPLLSRFASNAPVWELTPMAAYDPAARLRGWSALGRGVGEVLADERAKGREPFIMTDDYQVASEIAFYCPGNPPVYTAQSALGKRATQYDLWTNPIRDRELFIGRPCIYVGLLQPQLEGDDHGRGGALPGLRRARTVEHIVRGHRIRVWTIFVADRFEGFQAAASAKF